MDKLQLNSLRVSCVMEFDSCTRVCLCDKSAIAENTHVFFALVADQICDGFGISVPHRGIHAPDNGQRRLRMVFL